MSKQNTRDEILKAGVELIALNGFNATGVETILKSVGVPKGSFYHYFSSKEDFGLAVINYFAESYDHKLDSFFEDEKLPALLRIRAYMEASLAHMTQHKFRKGCLIGNLGQELADQSDVFRERLDIIFRSWKKRFTECLELAIKTGELPDGADTTSLAEFILAGWEGCLLRAKVMKSPAPMRNFIDILFHKVLTNP